MQKVFLVLLLLCCAAEKIQAQDVLNDYIRKAKENSPLLFDNKQQAQANELEAERLRAQYTKAQIGVTGGYMFAPIISKDQGTARLDPNAYVADKYVGYDLAASNGGLYQGLINYSQPLFNNGRYEAYAGQARVRQKINENTIQLTEHDIEKFVTDQYLLCLLDKNQMQFADSMLSIIKEQMDIVEKLVEGSILKQSDLRLLTIEYHTNRGLYATYKATYKRDLMDLNVLCGLDDTSFVLLPDLHLDLKPEQAPAQSSYLLKYKLDSLTLISTQQVFETKYKPQVNVYSNAGLNAVYAPTIPNRFGMSAGLNLTWNFYDGNQKSIMQEKTELQLEAVAFYRDNFLKQNNVRKQKILTELNSYDNRKTIAENQLKEYSALLEAYKKQIMQGQMSILIYITTLKNMTVAKRDYYILETNRQLLVNTYNYWNW
ncbi:MAG: hypothetical protein GC180_11470 [Bacteroidetes bacterium]|nr:hypothetical protein [Bacteroidota bacterium]